MRIGTLDGVLDVGLEELYQVARDIGFDGVELGVASSKADSSPLWQADTRAALKENSRKTGVATASLCLHGWGELAATDTTRDSAIAIAQQASRFAAELAAPVILVPLNAPSSMTYDEAASGWVEALRVAGAEAAKAGVVLAMESVGRTHTQSAARFKQLMERTDGQGVGIYYDVGNALYQGYDPLGDIRALGSLITQVHVKQPGQYLLADGPLNIAILIGSLVEIGYDGYLVLETAQLGDAVASARANLEYLRGLIS